MDTLKCTSLIVFVFLFACCNEYHKADNSFDGIYFKNWNSKNCQKKIVLNKYIKDSNFKNFIESDSNFTIEGCNESTRHYCFNCKIIDQEANHFDKIKKKMDC